MKVGELIAMLSGMDQSIDVCIEVEQEVRDVKNIHDDGEHVTIEIESDWPSVAEMNS